LDTTKPPIKRHNLWAPEHGNKTLIPDVFSLKDWQPSAQGNALGPPRNRRAA
jgi:hypothetical protein